MGTHRAGITCHVGNIFATNVSITTTEGNVDRASEHTTSTQYSTVIFVNVLLLQEYKADILMFDFFVSHKDGYEIFASWKKVWTSNGKSEPSLKAFMADQQLPFWVRASGFPGSC